MNSRPAYCEGFDYTAAISEPVPTEMGYLFGVAIIGNVDRQARAVARVDWSDGLTRIQWDISPGGFLAAGDRPRAHLWPDFEAAEPRRMSGVQKFLIGALAGGFAGFALGQGGDNYFAILVATPVGAGLGGLVAQGFE